MSYTMTTKTFTTTTPRTLAPVIAAWLVEQIPEATLMYTNTSESNYNYSYLAFDGMPYGFCVSSYYKTNSAIVYLGSAHSISASSGTKQHFSGTSMKSETTSNVTTYRITIAVVNTGSGYIISCEGTALYIGYITSALIGKRFVSIRVCSGGLCYCNYLSYNSSYDAHDDNGLSHSEDASTYNSTATSAIVSTEASMPSGSAILSPLYVCHQSLWAEPVLIPGIYYMQASSYPELFTPTQIGDKEAVLVGTNIAVV